MLKISISVTPDVTVTNNNAAANHFGLSNEEQRIMGNKINALEGVQDIKH